MLENVLILGASSLVAGELFTLHSFRRTYATALHRKGVDVRTLMGLLGHSDLETTLSYLAAMHAEESNDKVNAAFS